MEATKCATLKTFENRTKKREDGWDRPGSASKVVRSP